MHWYQADRDTTQNLGRESLPCYAVTKQWYPGKFIIARGFWQSTSANTWFTPTAEHAHRSAHRYPVQGGGVYNTIIWAADGPAFSAREDYEHLL